MTISNAFFKENHSERSSTVSQPASQPARLPFVYSLINAYQLSSQLLHTLNTIKPTGTYRTIISKFYISFFFFLFLSWIFNLIRVGGTRNSWGRFAHTRAKLLVNQGGRTNGPKGNLSFFFLFN